MPTTLPLASISLLLPQCEKCGLILVIGFTSGVFPVARANILLIKATSVIGANYGHFLTTQTIQARVQVERMLGWIAAGRFSPHIHRRFAFAECVAALEALAARQQMRYHHAGRTGAVV